MVKILKYCWYCNHDKRVGNNAKYCPTCGSILNRKSIDRFGSFTNAEEQKFERTVRETLKEAFSPRERKILLKNTTLSLFDPEPKDGSGEPGIGGKLMCSSWDTPNCKLLVNAEINRNKSRAAKSVVTHEFVHLLRQLDKKRKKKSIVRKLPDYYFEDLGTDKDVEEAITEAESVTRDRPKIIEARIKDGIGYYRGLEGIPFPQSLHEDKQILSGKHPNNVGIDAVNRVQKRFPKTNISKMTILHGIKGKRELVDQYFRVVNKKTGKISKVHIYSPGKNLPRERKAAKLAEFVDGITGNEDVYVYHDGQLCKVDVLKLRSKIRR